ncbi:glycosyltransferase family 39 protein [Gloeocapsa sp. PCC 73106]|uniref:glycosyltransferase family 39 protein n=1 Tax=Gloeocapsa sp. PCC 73106 TaxID=102232 RepID=UPI0002AC9000|nr:glycosyltransferase family 39 protein [Gloeocapsa sp. PCC 73106]ELR96482.1 PMT family glycosyltransferase, 4-amino-4-deoxy-L-arabinose transferase [Gloeocapsa sp. PCC 73106]
MIKQHKDLIILTAIWLAGIVIDYLWLSLDHRVPAWDQAEYLNGAIKYYEALQTPLWLEGQWWRELWLLSPKVPPLTYLLTVPFLNLFGTGADAAMLIMIPLSGILLYAVYSLGKLLFSPSLGLLAALICELLPGLYRYRLDYLLDFPLTVMVTCSFVLLTSWRSKNTYLRGIIWGISFGLGMLLKQPFLFFLLIPYTWLVGVNLLEKRWRSVTQLLLGLGIGILVFFPWYRTNWLLMLTSGKRATVDSAIAEGDPALNTIRAWTYYLEILPYLITTLLIVVAILGIVLYQRRKPDHNLRFLLIFLVGGYLLSSLNINKDSRYILPLLPSLSLLIAWGLLAWKGRWGYYVRLNAIALSTLLMLLHLFPLGLIPIRNILSPGIEHYPYLGQKWPNLEVIEEINQTSPYLHTTLGVLPSTPEINQHNLSFYGAQLEFPVSGRQVGVRKAEVQQDANSLDWFITKSGEQGSVPEAQQMIVELVESDSNFQLQQTWSLPEESELKLYHRQPSSLEVKPLATSQTQVKLEQIKLPASFPPGVPVPVTYEWTGSGSQLQQGIVLLTWINVDTNQPEAFWIHDHGLGMGRLKLAATESYRVIERTAMLSDRNLPQGNYRLEATYLNRDTLETYPIEIPDVRVSLDQTAEIYPAPELDLVTQLRLVAPGLALGIEGLEPVFATTARINQYDPRQDYLKQAEIALSYRLNQQPRLDWTYSLALAAVLQQDVSGALTAINKLIELDSDNPYNHAYLAFVYLYDWKPRPASLAIERAIALNPNVPEFIALRGISALLRGHFFQAWQDLSVLKTI